MSCLERIFEHFLLKFVPKGMEIVVFGWMSVVFSNLFFLNLIFRSLFLICVL